ncbi:MAG TPA: NADPH-dependent F420 reductase [Acidimicrobiales bacterium]|nr:NADPH-dependent F420 reductase [Acidimicrobiales bacterium]
MNVGILGGTGPAGSSLAARLASVGYDVTIGSRAKERAEEVCAALQARWPDRNLKLAAGDNAEAAAAEVVVVATPWDSAALTCLPLAEALAGKVVISMGNALVKVGRELQPVGLARGSVAGSIQAVAPDAFVAAAFQHLPARELGNLDDPVDCDVLICSDHPVATSTAAELASKIPGVRALDAGRLANAGAVEAFVAVLISLNIRYKTHAAVRLTGIEV